MKIRMLKENILDSVFKEDWEFIDNVCPLFGYANLDVLKDSYKQGLVDYVREELLEIPDNTQSIMDYIRNEVGDSLDDVYSYLKEIIYDEMKYLEDNCGGDVSRFKWLDYLYYGEPYSSQM